MQVLYSAHSGAIAHIFSADVCSGKLISVILELGLSPGTLSIMASFVRLAAALQVGMRLELLWTVGRSVCALAPNISFPRAIQ